MIVAPAKRSRRGRWLLWLVAALALTLLLFILLSALQIQADADLADTKKTDAIVVFGAAEYSGRPSPVYRARLDHALELFKDGRAPIVITTGGAGGDPSFSEGGVGHDYLLRRGIPEANLIAETQGTDTARSAERVAVIMKMNGMHSCTAVSDAYHLFRAKKVLEHEGVQVYVNPRSDSRPHSHWQRFLAVMREALSYTAWRLQELW